MRKLLGETDRSDAGAAGPKAMLVLLLAGLTAAGAGIIWFGTKTATPDSSGGHQGTSGGNTPATAPAKPNTASKFHYDDAALQKMGGAELVVARTIFADGGKPHAMSTRGFTTLPPVKGHNAIGPVNDANHALPFGASYVGQAAVSCGEFFASTDAQEQAGAVDTRRAAGFIIDMATPPPGTDLKKDDFAQEAFGICSRGVAATAAAGGMIIIITGVAGGSK